MKRYIYYCCLGLFSFFPNLIQAIDLVTQVPPHDAYITDLSETLSTKEEEALETQFEQLWKESDIEGAVLIISSLSGASLEDLSYRTAQERGIGDSETNNGFLFLVSIEDRQFRLEIGYGLEPVITDGRAQRILRTQAAPALAANDLPRAIEQVLTNVEAYASGENFIEDSSSENDVVRGLLSRAIIIFGIGWSVLPFILWNITEYPDSPHKRRMKTYAAVPISASFLGASAIGSSYVGRGVLSLLYGGALTGLLVFATKYYGSGSSTFGGPRGGSSRGGGSSFGSSFGGFGGGSFGGGGASGSR